MPLRRFALLAFVFLLLQPPARPQAPAPSLAAASAPTAVPALVPYTGVALAGDGKPLAGEALATFQIYKEEQGGEPLWAETQTVVVDATGHYKAQLGASNPNGLPADLFSSGEARWLEVQFAGQSAQPRVLLASVPYALKAGDSATLGGLPASAFALAGGAARNAAAGGAAIPDAASTVTTTGGTSGYLAEFSGTSTIVDSPLSFAGTAVTVGSTASPTNLDVTGGVNITGGMTVNGGATYNGQLLLPATGTATASTFYNSQLIKIYTSAYNSSTSAAVTPRFQWQGEVTGNDTASPGATLNLLYSGTSAVPAETGFHFNPNGTITFAPGQTFPGGTGTGTITGVTAGTGLTGGGSSGTVTLAVDPTKVAELGASNSFAGTQTIASGNLNLSGGDLNLPATTSANSGVITIGGVPFLHGYGTGSAKGFNVNVFVGDAGNFTTTGFANIGVGPLTLAADTTGFYNTAVGNSALTANTTGGRNTAVGVGSLGSDTTGSYNTGLGMEALGLESAGSDNTAVGSYAIFNQNGANDNTAVGSTTLYNNTTGSDNTGVGASALYSQTTGSGNTAVGTSALFSQTTASSNTAVGVGSLESDTTGSNNTAVGNFSLSDNTTGGGNIAVGGNALTANTTGGNSTAVGFGAMQSETTGGSSAAFGWGALGSDTAGCCNTAVGVGALNNNTTGSFLTAVGYDATSSSSVVVNNATALGAHAIVGQNNSLILGQTTDGKPGASFVNVGIGTATPRTTLEVAVDAPNALGRC
jgi:hypothetical protein